MRIGSHVVQIEGATALVTGATGGIGQAIARALHSRGASLVLTGRRADVLEPLGRDCGARIIAADLSEHGDVRQLVADAGQIDILVANAGLPASGTLDSFTVEQIDRALNVNLRSPIVLAQALSPAMVANGRGHMVFISSISGKAATAGAALYNATKFGLRGFASALRADMRPRGVGVSAVFPGFISDAGMFADSGARLPGYIGTRSPEEVARAVLTAIERDRAEVDVAPLLLRASAAFAGLAPELAARTARRLGAEELSAQIGSGQADKR
jgi:short-subunit dehydrogenase